MAGEFDEALAQQLRGLLQQVETSGNETAQRLGEASLSASDVLDVLSGNEGWVAQFEQRIEQQFEALGQRIVERWMQQVDTEIRSSLQASAELAISLFSAEGSSASQRVELADIFTQGGDVTGRLQRVIARSAGEFVEGLFTSTRTSQTESQRSHEEASRFKASRGQVSAELSDALGRGTRYR